MLELLHAGGGLITGSKIADIGSGTGIFTKLLLDEGYTVYAVEPNGDMRQAANAQLADHEHYHSINGTAEATTLQARSVAMVTCAQAFHWFNAERCKAKFARILQPGGKVALMWNNRQIEADEFSIDYEFLLRQESSDYERVNHQNLSEADFIAFFKEGQYQLSKFPNVQIFDEAGLIGRAFSSSYVPDQATPEGETFLHKLKDIFNRHQENGTVSVQYQTEVYLGEV